MNDAEWHTFLLGKLDEWLGDDSRPTYDSLLKHMKMSAEDFISWRETGYVPKVARLMWVIFDDECYDKIWGAPNV